jgi:hypothetical protein
MSPGWICSCDMGNCKEQQSCDCCGAEKPATQAPIVVPQVLTLHARWRALTDLPCEWRVGRFHSDLAQCRLGEPLTRGHSSFVPLPPPLLLHPHLQSRVAGIRW